uniref:Uncharacterized protein n=1 Tax=Lactuca sativa TaxID=4236 RepID=A0A9R1UF50_LACSA|nr:hypothetical protein LSAT_V11C900486260 [Lactuca sativa]
MRELRYDGTEIMYYPFCLPNEGFDSGLRALDNDDDGLKTKIASHLIGLKAKIIFLSMVNGDMEDFNQNIDTEAEFTGHQSLGGQRNEEGDQEEDAEIEANPGLPVRALQEQLQKTYGVTILEEK